MADQGSRMGQQEAAADARRNTAATPPTVVSAAGSRFEIGYEHGSQARELVKGTLDWSLQQLATGGVDRREAIRRAQVLLPYVQRYAPELLEESAGIAEGAGLSLTDLVIINARYELLFLTGSEAPRPGVAGAECTLFGLSGRQTESGTPVIGQNVDLGAEARPLWILLDLQPPGAPRVLTITMAGMLAQEGINSAGLALCGSMVRSSGWGEGLPTRKFLRRRVLEQRSVREAIQTIKNAPKRASSHNLLLADANSVADVETTADEVRVLEVTERPLAHTNHYLHAEFSSTNDNLGAYLENSRARLTRMQEMLDLIPRPLRLEALKAALADHAEEPDAVCRHAERDAWRGETNVAVIAEPAQRTLHVALGPPCTSPFFTYVLPEDSTAKLIGPKETNKERC